MASLPTALNSTFYVDIPFSLVPRMTTITFEGGEGVNLNILNVLKALQRYCPPGSLKKVVYGLERQHYPREAMLINAAAPRAPWAKQLEKFLRQQSASIQELVFAEAPKLELFPVLATFMNLAILDLGKGAVQRTHLHMPQLMMQGGVLPAQARFSLPHIATVIIRSMSTLISLNLLGVNFPNAEHMQFLQHTVPSGDGQHLSEILEYVAENLPRVRTVFIEAKIRLETVEPTRNAISAVTEQHLHGLMQNHRLERLEVAWVPWASFAVTNELLRDLALAWPSITHLSLDPKNGAKSRVSLHALRDFAQLCPKLEVLGIGLDPDVDHFVAATEIDLYNAEAAAAVATAESGGADVVVERRATLKSLNVNAPRLANANEAITAEFLMTIFPNLEHIAIPEPPPISGPPSTTRNRHSAFGAHPPPPLLPLPPAPPPVGLNPPPVGYERKKRLEVLDAWQHVIKIAKEMRKYGTRRVAEVLQESARSNIIGNMSEEKRLIQEEDDGDYMDETWEDEGSDEEMMSDSD